jgi:hypothetical protein
LFFIYFLYTRTYSHLVYSNGGLLYKAWTSKLCMVKAHAHYCGLVPGLCVGE